MKNLKNVNDFINCINKGTFGICLVSLTEPKMNKTSNPYFGKVKKLTYTTNVALGYDYVNYLESKAKKQGIVDFKFETEKPKGKSWHNHPYMLVSDKDETKFYLRCYYRPNTKSVSLYFYDGRLATDSEVAEIKSFMPSKKMSVKQIESGLSEENEVLVRDYIFDNVIALWQGDKVYNRLDSFLTLKQIKELFK